MELQNPGQVDLAEKKNWLLLLSYNGWNYHGWQIQPKHETIESELEKAINTLTGEKIKVYGAGRTDAKVHALNQTANFYTDSKFSAEKWQQALNGLLPSEIVVKCVLPVPLKFHARHNATGKRYSYLINNYQYPSPFGLNLCWWIHRELDWDSMAKAAGFLIGEHDFSSFRASGCSSPSPVKKINEIVIKPTENHFATHSIEIEGNSFLQHMVRIIVGTLVDVGEKRKKPEDVEKILQSKDRTKSGRTAPAHGLYVLKVHYKDEEI